MTTTGRDHARTLATQARERHALSKQNLAHAAGITPKTLGNFENGVRWPQSYVLNKIERALGLRPGAFEEVANHPEPLTITLEDLHDAAPVDVTNLSDADLIWHLTTRLQERAQENARLRAELEQTQQPPANVYDLAADEDRSGHGRHLAAETDQAGEEPQDRP